MQVLIESLQRKNEILEKIQEINEKQKNALSVNPILINDFDICTEEKGQLIEELEKLDNGFDKVYDRVRESLLENRETLKSEIKKMQHLIQDIMDKSVSIQAEEARNKKLMESGFGKERKKYKEAKISSKVALNYYSNMSKTNYVDPQFMDKKK